MEGLSLVTTHPRSPVATPLGQPVCTVVVIKTADWRGSQFNLRRPAPAGFGPPTRNFAARFTKGPGETKLDGNWFEVISPIRQTHQELASQMWRNPFCGDSAFRIPHWNHPVPPRNYILHRSIGQRMSKGVG